MSCGEKGGGGRREEGGGRREEGREKTVCYISRFY
jgi:hypothetical protein